MIGIPQRQNPRNNPDPFIPLYRLQVRSFSKVSLTQATGPRPLSFVMPSKDWFTVLTSAFLRSRLSFVHYYSSDMGHIKILLT